jgi:TMEM175 potassium channel family protein
MRTESSPTGPGPARDAATVDRLVLFSDAVIAIAITILALDVRLPELPSGATNDDVLQALGRLMPRLAAFAISFVVIMAFWVGHLRTFRVIRRIDGRLIILNGAFLFFVVLLPFPTAAVAEHGDLGAVAILYASFGVVIGLLSSALWVYPASIAGLTEPSVTPDLARRITWRVIAIPVVFAASIPIALASPTAAELAWVLAGPIQAIVSRRLHLGLALRVADAAADPAEASAGPRS